MNRSFLKWAGNKYKVLPHIVPLIGKPHQFCEPFGGSLTVALNVCADFYTLNDINKDLINVYEILLRDGSEFISHCKELFTEEANSREVYLERREVYNSTSDLREKASLFIYLNRHCFNGLTRYNKSGWFNVPFGKYNSPYFPEKEMELFLTNFRGKPARLTSLDFDNESLYAGLGEGDVVYFDPPYIPASQTANFTDYAKDGFNLEQHTQLANLARNLASRGTTIILSNSDSELTRQLYDGAKILSIEVSRTISAKGESRKKAKEVIAIFGQACKGSNVKAL